MTMQRRIADSLAKQLVAVNLLGVLLLTTQARASTMGRPVSEPGLKGRTDIIFFDDFEGDGSKLLTEQRRIVNDPGLALSGSGCLEVQHRAGSVRPMNSKDLRLPPGARYFMRFYVRFEDGYDFGKGQKGPGFYAYGKGFHGGGAGLKPTGRDKYSLRCGFKRGGVVHWGSYNPDQKSRWGTAFPQNIGAKVRVAPGRWFCVETMLKANDIGQKNGEVKGWIDGELKMHYEGIRFRDIEELKINRVSYSAYFGGTWGSPKDQKRYEENVVVATHYIGPRQLARPKKVNRKRKASRLIPPPRRKTALGDPLAPHAEALAAAERLAREGKWDEAAQAYRKVVGAVSAKPIRALIEMRLQGIEARPYLIQTIVKGVASEGSKAVYIDFAGRAERARLVRATGREGAFVVKGSRMLLPWQMLSPRRVAGIAAKYAASSADRIAIARFLLACGETHGARQVLDQALAARPTDTDARHARQISAALR